MYPEITINLSSIFYLQTALSLLISLTILRK